MSEHPTFSLPAFPAIIDAPIDGESSLGFVAQITVLSRFREMLMQRQAVVDNLDIEGVHKIRVAARRTRTALQTFDSIWRKGVARKFSKRLAKFADKFGEARDLDVLRKHLGDEADDEGIVTGEPYPNLESLAGVLRRAQQKKVNKAVKRVEKAGFVDKMVDYFSTHPVDLWKLDGEG